jgi:hypothetical protein
MTDEQNRKKQRKRYTVLDSADRVTAAQRLYEQGMRSLGRAGKELESGLYPESVSASRLSMEKFAQSVLALCLGQYPQAHHVPVDDAIEALKQIRARLSPIMAPLLVSTCARTMILSNMWATAYIPMTHGIQELVLSPTDLFDKRNAERAREDAQWCGSTIPMLLAQAEALRPSKQAE